MQVRNIAIAPTLTHTAAMGLKIPDPNAAATPAQQNTPLNHRRRFSIVLCTRASSERRRRAAFLLFMIISQLMGEKEKNMERQGALSGAWRGGVERISDLINANLRRQSFTC